MAIDLGRGTTGEFSTDDVNETLRKELLSLAGTDKIDYKTMRKFKPEIFELLEEVLDVLLVEGIEKQFDAFVDYRNVGWGDSPVFEVEDYRLFSVATIADGTGNLKRQRLDSGYLTVTTGTKGVKIYEEFYRFLAGRINFPKMIAKIAKSYNNQIATDIYNAVYGSFTSLSATYGIAGNFVENQMDTLISHVEAATGANCGIWGTKTALAKINPALISQNMMDKINQIGYVGNYKGSEMVAFKQAHTPGTDTFAINGNFAMILPQMAGENKIVKLVVEGDSIIQETPGGLNADMSMEYTFIKKCGIALVIANKFGIYRFA